MVYLTETRRDQGGFCRNFFVMLPRMMFCGFRLEEKMGFFVGKKLLELWKQAGRPFAETGWKHCPPITKPDDARYSTLLALACALLHSPNKGVKSEKAC